MTVPSYTGFNELVEKFGDDDFAVLGFPCAQFLNQEPGQNGEILDCLQYVRPGNGFVPNFTMFNKTVINGANTDYVYQWLKSGCGPTNPTVGVTQYISWTPVLYNDITWNFEKFLISKQGELVRRYSPETFPQFLVDDIADLINQDNTY